MKSYTGVEPPPFPHAELDRRLDAALDLYKGWLTEAGAATPGLSRAELVADQKQRVLTLLAPTTEYEFSELWSEGTGENAGYLLSFAHHGAARSFVGGVVTNNGIADRLGGSQKLTHASAARNVTGCYDKRGRDDFNWANDLKLAPASLTKALQQASKVSVREGTPFVEADVRNALPHLFSSYGARAYEIIKEIMEPIFAWRNGLVSGADAELIERFMRRITEEAGTDPDTVRVSTGLDGVALAAFIQTVAMRTKTSDQVKAIRALCFREPALISALHDRYVDESDILSAGSFATYLRKQRGFNKAFAKAFAAVLPSEATGSVVTSRSALLSARFPLPLMRSYPAKYLYYSNALEATNGLTALVDLRTHIAQMIAAGSGQRSLSSVDHALREAARLDAKLHQGDLEEDEPEVLEGRAELLAHQAMYDFISRCKSAFSNPHPGQDKLADLVDAYRSLAHYVLRPALYLAGRGQLCQPACPGMNMMTANILSTLTLDELIGFNRAWHADNLLHEFIAAASCIHEEWAVLARERQIVCEATGQPYTVEGIGNLIDLIRIGREESHCVGTYSDKCAYDATQIAVIRDVSGKIRATCEVSLERDGSGWLAQVKAAANAQPEPAVEAIAHRWFNEVMESPDISVQQIFEESDWRRSERDALRQANPQVWRGYNSLDMQTFNRMYDVFRKLAPTILREDTGEEFVARLAAMHELDPERVFANPRSADQMESGYAPADPL